MPAGILGGSLFTRPAALTALPLVCRDHDHLWDLLYERVPAIGGITEVETFLEIKMHKVSYGHPIPEVEKTADSSCGGEVPSLAGPVRVSTR